MKLYIVTLFLFSSVFAAPFPHYDKRPTPLSISHRTDEVNAIQEELECINLFVEMITAAQETVEALKKGPVYTGLNVAEVEARMNAIPCSQSFIEQSIQWADTITGPAAQGGGVKGNVFR